MNKSIICSVLILLTSVVIAQETKILTNIKNKLDNIDTYQSACTRSFSMPFGGDTLTYESLVTLKKIPTDGLCGYYYNYATTDIYRDDIRFNDFEFYFDSTVYSSYLGKVEKVSYADRPSQFIGFKINNSYVPPIHERGSLTRFTPYGIAAELESLLKDTSMSLTLLSDTIIELDTCYRFHFNSKEYSSHGTKTNSNKVNFEMCFSTKEYFLVYYKSEVFSKMFNQIEEVTFRNTIINEPIPVGYFSEDNLLPDDWENQSTKDIEPKKNPDEMLGRIAPSWNLPILGSDKSYASSNLKGKFTLLEFTATWCGHCYSAAKMMNRLEEKFEKNKNIEILSIFSSEMDKKEGIERFANKLEISVPVLYDAVEVGKKYRVHGYPDFFIISPEGNILNIYCGYGPEIEDLIIEELTKLTSE